MGLENDSLEPYIAKKTERQYLWLHFRKEM